MEREREREGPPKVLNLVVLFDNGCARDWPTRGPLDLPMRSAMIGYLRWNIPPSQCEVERWALLDTHENEALLKNLGPSRSGGHSSIFMEDGVRNTLI